MSTPTRRTLRRARHELCQAWRAFFIARGAIEVTTPILHRYPDIAPVRQFTTRHPTTGAAACLRIAPTEHLKRLLADGEQQVFEFAANFRDDPVDKTHLPEFMSVEYMAVNATCTEMEKLAVELCRVAIAVLAPLAADGPPSWASRLEAGQFERISIAELMGLESSLGELDLDALDQVLAQRAAAVGGVVLVGDFPENLGGPAVGHPALAGFKQRTEVFINGLEIANMSTTLTDPAVLTSWHDDGLSRKATLGIEPNEKDLVLFDAVDRGIPDSAVIGLGIERILQAYFALENMGHELSIGY